MIVSHLAPHIGVAMDQGQPTTTLFVDRHGGSGNWLAGICQALIQLLRGVGLSVLQDSNVGGKGDGSILRTPVRMVS